MSFSDAIRGAIVAIVKVLTEKETAKPLTSSSGAVGPGISTSKVVNLRMKNEKLRFLQQLYEDILNENEYSEQKNKILPHFEILINRCSGYMYKQFVKVDKFHSRGSKYNNIEVLPAEIPGVKRVSVPVVCVISFSNYFSN